MRDGNRARLWAPVLCRCHKLCSWVSSRRTKTILKNCKFCLLLFFCFNRKHFYEGSHRGQVIMCHVSQRSPVRWQGTISCLDRSRPVTLDHQGCLAPLGSLEEGGGYVPVSFSATSRSSSSIPSKVLQQENSVNQLHLKTKGMHVRPRPLSGQDEAGLCVEVTARSCATCLGHRLKTPNHSASWSPASSHMAAGPLSPRSPSRFPSGTLTITRALWPLSYLPGLLCRGQVLNKTKIPLTLYRLDLIKHPLIKGKQMSASIS